MQCIKERLGRGECVFGTWNSIPSASLVNAISFGGVDFIVADTEHGPASVERVEDLVRAAEVKDVPCLVRVPSNSPELILRALDIGAHGVHVPHVSTKEEAEAVVKAVKYHPEGERGYSPFTRAGGYGLDPKDHASRSNKNTVVVVHIEGKKGIKNLAGISGVKGIDVVFIGPYDLSQSLGKPGMVEDPEVVGVIKRAVKTVKAKGKICGSFSNNERYLGMLCGCGMRYLTYKVDASFIAESYAKAFAGVKGKLLR